jgi:hypothetical protein
MEPSRYVMNNVRTMISPNEQTTITRLPMTVPMMM